MASYVRKEKLVRGLMIYQRERSPYWYARLKRPEKVGDKKTTGYRNLSLKTDDLEEAKRLAFAAFEAQASAPSSSSPDFSWDALWKRYLRDRASKRPSLEHFWNCYLRTYIQEKKIKAVEDFTLSHYREFIEYRRNFWVDREYTGPNKPKNLAKKPMNSTLKENLTMASTILSSLYTYIDKPRPDFTTINRNFASRLARTQSRLTKTRGFALTPMHWETLRQRLHIWAHDDSIYNENHRYARHRLYYAVTLAYLTRARPGTELTNIRKNDLDWTQYTNLSTYRIETTGKLGPRLLLMEIDKKKSGGHNAMFRLWVNTLHADFPNCGFDVPNPYIFAGSKKSEIDNRRRIDGNTQLPKSRLNQLFKAFLRRPENEDIRFHPAGITGRGGDDSVELTLYDIRTTSISHFISTRGNELNQIEMARLCGVSVATMDYYYVYFDEMRNADKWLGYGNAETEEEAKAIKLAQLKAEMTESLIETRLEIHRRDQLQVPENQS